MSDKNVENCRLEFPPDVMFDPLPTLYRPLDIRQFVLMITTELIPNMPNELFKI